MARIYGRGITRRVCLGGALVAALLLGGMLAGHAAGNNGRTLEEFFAPGLKDITLTTRPVKSDIDELNKIGRDFGNAYRVSRSRISIKEPGRFRLDARVGIFQFQYIIVGERNVTRTPISKSSRNIGKDPGKRQGPLDIGLVTAGALPGYIVEHLGCGEEAGRPSCSFRLTFAHDTARYEQIWIDTERKCLLRRRMYTNFQGEMKMEYRYLEPVAVGSVWIPTRVEVYSPRGKLAGVTEQKEFSLNTGLDDSAFKL